MLSASKQNIEEKMQKVLGRATDELGLDTKKMKLECNDQHGYFFRVTLAEEHALRQNKSFRIIDAVKGGVRFTNSKLESLNESYSNIKQSYEQQQRSIVQEILDVAGKSCKYNKSNIQTERSNRLTSSRSKSVFT